MKTAKVLSLESFVLYGIYRTLEFVCLLIKLVSMHKCVQLFIASAQHDDASIRNITAITLSLQALPDVHKCKHT